MVVKKCKCCGDNFNIKSGKGLNTLFCGWACRYFYKKMLLDNKPATDTNRQKITMVRRIPQEHNVVINTDTKDMKNLNLKQNDTIIITIQVLRREIDDNKSLTPFEEIMLKQQEKWEEEDKAKAQEYHYNYDNMPNDSKTNTPTEEKKHECKD